MIADAPAQAAAQTAAQHPCRLSICITTRNRCAALLETLESALAQMPEGVEVVVVDGVSTDDTPTAMGALAARDARVRYFRETVNGGIDRDYDKAVGYARGVYCWMMADDDLFLPGAIDRVLQALTGEPSLVVVDAEVRDETLTRLLQPCRLHLERDIRYGPAQTEALFTATADHLSFIGATVVRRSLWLSREREAYYGSYFIHLGVIFQQPLPGDAVVLARPGIAIRYGVASWSPRAFEISGFLWPRLIWSFNGLSEQARAAVSARQPFDALRILLMLRAGGGYSLSSYRRWLAGCPGPAWRRALQQAIAVTPGWLLNPLALGWLLAFSRKDHRYRDLIDQLNSPYCLLRGPWRRLQAARARALRPPPSR
jgi:glycosyltransferase involved in cell wall biosynthesis